MKYIRENNSIEDEKSQAKNVFFLIQSHMHNLIFDSINVHYDLSSVLYSIILLL